MFPQNAFLLKNFCSMTCEDLVHFIKYFNWFSAKNFNLVGFSQKNKKNKVTPEATFIWKLLKVGILEAKGQNKDVPKFEVCDTPTASPTLPLFRTLLVQRLPSKDFFDKVYFPS